MTSSRVGRRVILSMAGLLAAGEVAAQVPVVPPLDPGAVPVVPVAGSESPSHHGLYLGAQLGLGELHFHYGPYVFWGPSQLVDLWAGGALTPNLVLFGQLYDGHVFGPSSTYGELSDLNFIGVGPGLKYYLTPADLFLSGSVMLSKFHFGIAASGTFPDYSQGVDETTDWGATLRLAIGKEWPVSRRWSLGLEGEALYGRMSYPQAYEDSTGIVKSFSLLVSAAYGHDPVEHGPGRRAGLHLELRGGAGALRMSSDYASASATGVPFGVSAGTSLTHRLSLFGDLSYVRVSSPRGAAASFDTGALYGFGPRLEYTLTSNDLFLSATPFVAEVSIDGGTQTHWGWGGDLSLGKQWWLTPRWGVGLAGDLFRAQVSSSSTSPPVIEGASLLGLIAYNQEAVARATPDDVDERDDSGNFYIETRGGIGHLWSRYGVDYASGTIVPLELSVGRLFSPRVAVLGDVTYARVPHLSSGSYPGLQSARAHGFGLRVKYYLQPGSTFVAAAAGYMHFSFGDPSPYYTPGPQTGLGVHLTAGKEWWLLRHWAVGVAADLLLGAVEGGEDGMHVPKALSLLALLAYNSPRSDSGAGRAAFDEPPSAAVAAAQPEIVASPPPTPASGTAPQPASVIAAPPPRLGPQGFYVGARLGVGWLDVASRSGNGSTRIHGFGMPFALSAGWALTREWVLFGAFFEHQVRRPDNSYDIGLIDVDLIAVGPGVTYYGLPAGMFASLAASLSQISYRDGAPLDSRYGINLTSRWGYTGRLSVGKEWRVSSYWALGGAAEAGLGRMDGGSRQEGTVYTVKTLAVLATVSFD